MKIVIAAVLAFAAVLIYAERCVGPMDCQITLCANGSNLICERQECTCSPIPDRCQTRDDCLNLGKRCPNRYQSWHCVDNICTCY
ncbi:serine protease inhibitor Cvsi-2-like [Ruditapes philippinarum]|uniref:serine protease inhibitor Cvsi-2-like n=1 Tax=Ruditapes philippinarum TaxID=129788 RepID=UPI00295B0A67|nr:serine protease inhibitor Cvsi-2-like [Ruditapes philippinarum]